MEMADGKWQMAKSHKGHGKTRWGYASSRYFKVSFFRRAIRMRILGCNGRAKVRICSLMFAYVRIFEKKFATEAPRHRGSIQWQAEFDTTKNHGRVVDSLAPARSALAGLHLRSNGAPALAKCFPGLDGRCRDMQTFRRWAPSLPFSRPYGLRLGRILFATSQVAQIPSGSSHIVHIVRDCPSDEGVCCPKSKVQGRQRFGRVRIAWSGAHGVTRPTLTSGMRSHFRIPGGLIGHLAADRNVRAPFKLRRGRSTCHYGTEV